MIYHVQVTYDTVVEAPSRHEAIETVRRHAREEIAEALELAHWDVARVEKLSSLPGQWDGDCLPWGGDGKTPLKEKLV